MKGHTNNPNGRPKGTPNKVTKELRQLLKNVVADEIERLPELFAKLPERDRLELLTKLLPYAMPKVEPSPFHVGERVDWFSDLDELELPRGGDG